MLSEPNQNLKYSKKRTCAPSLYSCLPNFVNPPIYSGNFKIYLGCHTKSESPWPKEKNDPLQVNLCARLGKIWGFKKVNKYVNKKQKSSEFNKISYLESGVHKDEMFQFFFRSVHFSAASDFVWPLNDLRGQLQYYIFKVPHVNYIICVWNFYNYNNKEV